MHSIHPVDTSDNFQVLRELELCAGLSPSAASTSTGGPAFCAGGPVERGAGDPPCTNRGGEFSHNSSAGGDVESLDWLSVTVHAALADCAEYFKLLGAELQERSGGMKGFTESYEGAFGLLVGAEPATGCYTSIFLPGGAIRGYGLPAVEAMVAAMMVDHQTGRRINVTRIDYAIDTQRFKARQVGEEVRAGRCQLHVKRKREYSEFDGEGYTLYLGSPLSEKQVRIYHKTDGDSFGDGVAFTRVELQLRGDVAMLAMLEWFWRPAAERGEMLKSWLLSIADFEASWWREFVDGLSSIGLKVKGRLQTIQKKLTWLEHQVSRSLAVVASATTGGERIMLHDFLFSLLEMGQAKMRPGDVPLILNYQESVGVQVVF